jgi:hypothetical protein
VTADSPREAAAHDGDVSEAEQQAHLAKGVSDPDGVSRAGRLAKGPSGRAEIPRDGLAALRVSGRDHQEGTQAVCSLRDEIFLARMCAGSEDDGPVCRGGPQHLEGLWVEGQGRSCPLQVQDFAAGPAEGDQAIRRSRVLRQEDLEGGQESLRGTGRA